MDKSDLIWFIPLIFATTFFIPYVITMKLLAYFSGWERLAEKYRYLGVFGGNIFYRQSARIKWTSYKGCLKVGVNDQGLYLAPMWIFSMFHKPLFIPWGDLELEPYEKFILSGCKIRVRHVKDLTIFLYGDMCKSFPVQTGVHFE